MARDGRRPGAAPSRPRRQQRDRRHRCPRRPRHATIGAHRRNSARDLDARSLNSKSPNALQRYLLERLIGPAAQHVLRHPWAFAWQTMKGFSANQGLLLAGAVAYYALLSIVPLLILTVIALSHGDRPARAARDAAAATSSGWCRGSRRRSSASSPTSSTSARASAGCCSATMIFFSSLAFTVLENAMSVIFLHRVVERKRRFIFSVLIPYVYILSLGIGPAPGDARRRQPAGGGQGKRRAVRPRVVAERRSRASCSTCSASPARSSS